MSSVNLNRPRGTLLRDYRPRGVAIASAVAAVAVLDRNAKEVPMSRLQRRIVRELEGGPLNRSQLDTRIVGQLTRPLRALIDSGDVFALEDGTYSAGGRP